MYVSFVLCRELTRSRRRLQRHLDLFTEVKDTRPQCDCTKLTTFGAYVINPRYGLCGVSLFSLHTWKFDFSTTQITCVTFPCSLFATISVSTHVPPDPEERL